MLGTLDGCGGAGPLLADPARGTVDAACAFWPRVAAFDVRQAHVVGGADSGFAVNLLALDAASGRLYAAGDRGMASAYDVRGEVPVRIAQEALGAPIGGAVVDPRRRRVYLPVCSIHGVPTLLVNEETSTSPPSAPGLDFFD